jgi:hypothetical protein
MDLWINSPATAVTVTAAHAIPTVRHAIVHLNRTRWFPGIVIGVTAMIL